MKLIQYTHAAPRDRTVTRRKKLAQSIRNELQDYKGSYGANEFNPQTKRLQKVLNDLVELIDLEGLDIGTGEAWAKREAAILLTPNGHGGWDTKTL